MNRAVFLDRDGTINVDKHYLHRIEDFEFIPGAIDGLRLLQNDGFLLVIITNQSGIARGYFTEQDYERLNGWMLENMAAQGITIARVYHCPHLPDAAVEAYKIRCNCRKPALGMFKSAIMDFDIDLSRSWAIGDKLRDCCICETSACRGVLIGANERPEIIASVRRGECRNIVYANNLFEAAKHITEVTV